MSEKHTQLDEQGRAPQQKTGKHGKPLNRASPPS
jgi:hypothetical protein